MNQTPNSNDCAAKLKILAEPTRLSILRQLFSGPKHVATLNSSISIDQSLLSHHLRILRDARLVEASRDGKSVLYSLTTTARNEVGELGIQLGCCQLSFPPDQNPESV